MIYDGDEESPYLVAEYICDFVKKTYNPKNEGNIEYQSLLSRIRELRDWSIGVDDESEAHTVYIVGLYEELCMFEGTHSLIPLITEKEDFIRNKGYLTSWIGSGNYEQILQKWPRKVPHGK